MTEYIDRESLLREFDELEPYEEYECEHALWLDMRTKAINAPAADVAPVRHGRWKLIGADKRGRGGNWDCSVCHKSYPYQCDYCPNCGAKMDGGEG